MVSNVLLAIVSRRGRELCRMSGASADGSGVQPENTLEAFGDSVAAGCDALELDVRLTKDGVLVTHHDSSVERTSEGSGNVIEHTLAELKALNFGYHFLDCAGGRPYRERSARIAGLEELFQRYPGVPMIIELKDRGKAGRRAGAVLAGLIAKYHAAQRVLVASFDDATLEAFRGVAGPNVGTSCARRETLGFVMLRWCGLSHLWSGGVMAFQPPADPRESAGLSLANAGFIGAAHARNAAVHYWTVNEEKEVRRLADMGADGLITDYPGRVRGILTEAWKRAGEKL